MQYSAVGIRKIDVCLRLPLTDIYQNSMESEVNKATAQNAFKELTQGVHFTARRS